MFYLLHFLGLTGGAPWNAGMGTHSSHHALDIMPTLLWVGRGVAAVSVKSQVSVDDREFMCVVK